MKSSKLVFFLVYLIFGLYLIVYGLNLIGVNLLVLPDFFAGINKWVILLGGILVILGGINQLRLSKYSY